MIYTDANIRQDDGSYKFTQATTVNVADGTAIDAAANIKINAEDTALTLDAKKGIVTNGKTVDISARTLHLSAQEDAITADGGKVTSLALPISTRTIKPISLRPRMLLRQLTVPRLLWATA